MPSCFGASGSVRTRQNIQSASARVRGPDLLAVHHPEVAVEHGARAQRGEVAARARLAVALAPLDLAEQRVAHEELLLLLGAVLDQRRHEHARPLPDHLAGRLGAAELLGDDRRLQRIGRLLAAAVAARDVAVEVAALDRLEAERGGAFVGADDGAHQGGLTRPEAGTLLRSSSVQCSSRKVRTSARKLSYSAL